jgi:lipoate-protein ligase A
MNNNTAEQWLLWQDSSHDAFFNMAVDEVALKYAAQLEGRVLLRIYDWDTPSVSYGRSQTYPAELADSYTLVRRPTGGGVVYHDHDLTYTLVIPNGHPITALDRMASYKVVHEAIADILHRQGMQAELKADEQENVDRATMQCFVSPSRFDVMGPGGAKFAGAAQRRTREGILHQGSLLFDEPGRLEKVRAELPDALTAAFNAVSTLWTPPAEWISEAEALAVDKYRTREWLDAGRY